MSTCISRHGEFSSHTLDDSYTCTFCHVLDEDALRAELEQARRERDDARHEVFVLSNSDSLDSVRRGVELAQLRGRVVTLLGIVGGLERFDGYDPASASVTVHAIKQIFGETGGEPLLRRSLDAETLLWAADELDAQARAHGENLTDYTDHLRCFTEQPDRKSIVPRPGGNAPVESAPAAETPSCDEPVWDGPYKMRCGRLMTKGECMRHGKPSGGAASPATPDTTEAN